MEGTISCKICGIFWIPDGVTVGCPLCGARAELLSAPKFQDMTELEEALIKAEGKIEKQKVKSKKREQVIIVLKKELKDLNENIDKAQRGSQKKTRTVDDVMDKKLEKATKKALKE